jgi:hypothetical protein
MRVPRFSLRRFFYFVLAVNLAFAFIGRCAWRARHLLELQDAGVELFIASSETPGDLVTVLPPQSLFDYARLSIGPIRGAAFGSRVYGRTLGSDTIRPTMLCDESELVRLLGMSGLRDIRWLDLSGTKISAATLKVLTPYKELERLYLEGTSITEADVREIVKLQRLRYIGFSDGTIHLR